MLSETRPLFGRVALGTLAVGATLAATACGSLPLLPPALQNGGETVTPEPVDTATPTDSAESPEPVETETAEPEYVNVGTLVLGDCFNEMDRSGDGISEVPKVDCSQPHDYEIYHVGDIQESGDYPGADRVSQLADEMCRAEFDAFIGLPYADSVIDYEPLSPTEDGWNELNDREVLCLAYNMFGEQVTGSLEGSGI
ncbi:hypothetical protein CQJ94_14280 [Glycomyces fuscus]|nr:hypothetical protein CQJ94_14280 [Glycomyces fuscus]